MKTIFQRFKFTQQDLEQLLTEVTQIAEQRQRENDLRKLVADDKRQESVRAEAERAIPRHQAAIMSAVSEILTRVSGDNPMVSLYTVQVRKDGSANVTSHGACPPEFSPAVVKALEVHLLTNDAKQMPKQSPLYTAVRA